MPLLIWLCAAVWPLSAQPLVNDELQMHFDQFLRAHPDRLAEDILQSYRRHEFRPLWVDSAGLESRSYTLFHRLLFAERQGLDAEDYGVEAIRARWKLHLPGDFELETLLTSAFIRYARDLYQGRFDPDDVDPDWHIRPKSLDVQSLLEKLHGGAELESMIDSLEPRHPSYLQLREQLQRYRNLARQGGWAALPEGPVLKPGMRHDQVPLIRTRLRISGDLVSGSLSTSLRYDEVLAEAVMRFQARHGIKIDGHIGEHTRLAMNVSAQQRIRQILINMERWRWLPRDLGQRYLLVNMSGFELYVEENARVIMAMPIIVGKQYRATPTFSDRVRYIEVNPYWTVPRRIVLEDLIPVQLRDPDYFSRKGIRVFDGWQQGAEEIHLSSQSLRQLSRNNFPYVFRQDPGPYNSLGRIKFMFPNPYSIYLHDTPHRYLFERRARAFSSGCIRVAEPVRLAAYLLGGKRQQQQERVLDLIQRGEHKTLSLSEPVPIYLIYWTAWADYASGSLHFRDDIYQRDRAMAEYLDLNKK